MSSLCCDVESTRFGHGCNSSWLDEELADSGEFVSMITLKSILKEIFNF